MTARRPPLAAFGVETRYVARLYLTQIVLVGVSVLAVVLALDLAGNFELLMRENNPAQTPEGIQRLGHYLFLRMNYNLPAILPIASAIGVIWAEYRLARGNERAMIFNTGRAPIPSLIPALLVGLLLGGAQVAFLAHARPHAVEAQALAGYRDYGAAFRGGTTARQWIATDSIMMHTRIHFGGRFGNGGKGVTLRDVSIYSVDASNRLVAVGWAKTAIPSTDGLELGPGSAFWPETPPRNAALTRVVLNPTWLSYFGVPARFLPQDTLKTLASARSGVPGQEAYRASLQDRRASVARICAMMILMALLCQSLMSPRMSLRIPLSIAAAGYTVHVAGNVLSSLGEFGRLPAITAAWGLPGGLIVLCAVYLWHSDRRVRRTLAAITQAR